jgi:hypothetical protein
MALPLVGLAVGAVARAAAKKAAQEAAKKAATKAAKKVRTSVKVSSNVKVIPGKMSPTSVRASSVNEKLMSGADKARSQNAAKSTGSSKSTSKALKNVNNPKNSPLDSRGKPNVKALKAANKKTNKTGSAMNKLERKYFQDKSEMIKSMQNTERAKLSKSSRKTKKGK